MRMDPAEIRSGGTKVGNAGEDLQRVFDTLKSALDAEGECWGNDEAGQEFAKSYVKASEDVSNGMKKLAKGLDDIKSNLHRTAADTEERDKSAAEDIGKIPPPPAVS
jgi:uncharacterized protein YukE